jgi:hypothetical protein
VLKLTIVIWFRNRSLFLQKHKTKVITFAVEDKYDTHKSKIPKRNKLIVFFYVTLIKSCSNRLPEDKGSVAFNPYPANAEYRVRS